MDDERIKEIVAAAVERRFDQWADEHPSLASVIDRIRLTDRAVESLRQSDQYRRAIEAYHRDLNDMNLLTQLVDLAGPILAGILGL